MEPRRKCIVTGLVDEKPALLRFVVGPEDKLFADVDGRLPGRGVWVSAERTLLETAIKKRHFQRALRQPVDVPVDLADIVEQRLLQRCLDLLGMARRAGELVTGFEKVRSAIKSGRVGVLVQAADAAADGRRKLLALYRIGPVVDAFHVEELSLALGHENVVHAALSRSRLAERFVEESERLRRYRSAVPLNAKISVEQA